jgi:aerobic carbon-monoxide dehydrogenase medium subunit
MKPARFEYRRMGTLDELLDALRHHGEEARILAGGQSLMPMLNMRLARPAHLLDINPINALAGWREEKDRVVCGALVRHRTLEYDAGLAASVPLLARAAPSIAHPAVRNRGSLGGSLALADPAAELPAVALCLGAEITLLSVRGERRVAAAEFFQGAMTTSATPEEALAAVSFPAAQPDERFAFLEVTRRHGDFALAGVAARARGGAVTLAFFGVGPRPQLAPKAAALVAANAPAGDIKAALAAEIEFSGDDLYPASYRLELAAVLARRAGVELGT